MAVLLLLKLLLACVALGYIVWRFGSRLVVALAPLAASSFGISLQLKTLSSHSVTGLRITLKQGPVHTVELDSCSIHFTNGMLACVLAWLQGKPALHVVVSGLRVSLAKTSGSKKSSAPALAAADPPAAIDVEQQLHSKDALSKVQKLARKLHKLLSSLNCIMLDASHIQLANQQTGLVLQLPHVTWQQPPSVSAVPAASQQQLPLQPGQLSLQQVTVSLLQEDTQANGSQMLRLLSCAGLSIQLTPAASRREGHAVLQSMAVTLGQVQVSGPAHAWELLMRKLGVQAATRGDTVDACHQQPAATVCAPVCGVAGPAADLQSGLGGQAHAKKAKLPPHRQLQHGLTCLNALVDKATLQLKGISLDVRAVLPGVSSAHLNSTDKAASGPALNDGKELHLQQGKSSLEGCGSDAVAVVSLLVSLGVSVGACSLSLERHTPVQSTQHKGSGGAMHQGSDLQYAFTANMGTLDMKLGVQASAGTGGTADTAQTTSQKQTVQPVTIQVTLPSARVNATAASSVNEQQQGAGGGHLTCTLSTALQGAHVQIPQSSIRPVCMLLPAVNRMLQAKNETSKQEGTTQFEGGEVVAPSSETGQEGLMQEAASSETQSYDHTRTAQVQAVNPTTTYEPLAHSLSLQLQTTAAVILQLPSADPAMGHMLSLAPSTITCSSSQAYVMSLLRDDAGGGATADNGQAHSNRLQDPSSRAASPEKLTAAKALSPINVGKPKQGSPGPGGSPAIRVEVPASPESPPHSGALALTPLMLTPATSSQPPALAPSRFATQSASKAVDAVLPESTGSTATNQQAFDAPVLSSNTPSTHPAPAPAACPKLAQLHYRVSIELGSISWATGDRSATKAQQQARTDEDVLLIVQEASFYAGTLHSTMSASALTPRATMQPSLGSRSGPCAQHVGLLLHGATVHVSDENVAAVLQLCEQALVGKQVLAAAKTSSGRKDKPGKQHKAQLQADKYSWLEQLDVQSERVQLRVSHTMPVVSSLSLVSGSLQNEASANVSDTAPGAAEASRDSGSAPVGGKDDIRQLPCTHVFKADSVQLCVLPGEETWAAGLRGLVCQQELPAEASAASSRTSTTTGAAPYVERQVKRPAVQRCSTGRGMGLMDSAPDTATKGGAAAVAATRAAKPQRAQHDAVSTNAGVMLEPLRVGVLDLRGQKNSERHFLRASMDEVDAHADFDCALAVLGMGSSLLQHASKAWCIRKPQAAGSVPLTPSQKATASKAKQEKAGNDAGTGKAAVQVPVAVELRISDLHSSAHVGAQDVLQLTCGLLRGSSSLQEVVLDELQLQMNGRDVISAQYASLKLPEPMPGDVAQSTKPHPPSPHTSMTFNPVPFKTPTKGKQGKPHFNSPPDSGGVQQRGGYEVSGGDGDTAGAYSVHSTDRSRLRPMHGRTRSQDSDDRSPDESQGAGHADAVPCWQRMMRQGHSLLGSLWQYEPATTLGSRRANVLSSQGPAGVKTTELRRQAARERLGLACPHGQPHAHGSEDVKAGAAHASVATEGSTEGPRQSERRDCKMLGVDMVLEGACLSFPYDEAPMRVYILCELWLGAAKQVLKPCLSYFTSTLLAHKPLKVSAQQAEAASAQPQPRQPWPLFDKYIELLIEARKVDVVLEQHPLEAWLALHMSALQTTAAERQLWERLATSLPTPRPSAHEVQGVPAHSATAGAAMTAPLQRQGSAGQQSDFNSKRLPVVLHSSGSISSMDPNTRNLDSMLEAEIQAMASRHRAPIAFNEDDGAGSSDPSSLSFMSSDEDNSPDCAWKVTEMGAGAGVANAGQGPAIGSLHGGAAGSAAQGHSQAAGTGSYWELVVRKVSSLYMAACKELQARPGPGKGALMHVSASKGSAVLMVCKPGVTARAHAAQEIARLDAPSQGLLFEKMVPLSMDAVLQDVVIKAGAAKAPLLLAASLTASGLLIRARQLTATPRTQPLTLPVGRLHAATIQRPVKGCRAPMKAYTDLRVEVEELEVAGGLGLEPVMAQVTKAFKSRIIPPDYINSDGSAVPQTPPGSGLPLPPWDKMRCMWRGCLRFTGRHVRARMGVGLTAVPGPFEPSLQLTATTLGLNISTGRLDANLTSLSLLAHGIPPDGRPGDPLLLLPLAHLPLLTTCLHSSWEVAVGRDATQHHVFPLRYTPPEPGETQDPVDINSLARSEGLILGMDFNLAADYTTMGQRQAGGSANVSGAGAPSAGNRARVVSGPGGNTNQSGSAALLSRHFSASSNLAPSPTPRVYIGELQVSFIRDWIQSLTTAPPMLRGSLKKRCFYEVSASPCKSSSQSPTPAPSGSTASSNQPGVEKPPQPSSTARSIMSGNTSQSAAKALPGAAFSNATTTGSEQPTLSEATVPLTIPALITRLDINAAADVIDVHHDAQDLADVSDFVYLRGTTVRLASNVAFARTLSWQQRGTRQVPRWMRQATSSSLSCEASELSLVQPERGGPPTPELTGLVVAQRRMASSSSTGHRTQDDMAEPQSGPAAPVPSFGEGLILSARQLQLRLAPPPRGPLTAAVLGGQLGAPRSAGPTVPAKRPLRMIIQDVQIFGSAGQRDTLVATVMHLVAAFTRRAEPPAAQPVRGPATQHAPSTASLTSDAASKAMAMDSTSSDVGWAGSMDGRSLANVSDNAGAGAFSGHNRRDAAAAAGKAVSIQSLSTAPSLEAAAASEAALVAALLQSRHARLQEELSAVNASAAAADQDDESTAAGASHTPNVTSEQDLFRHSQHNNGGVSDDLPDTPRAVPAADPESPHRSISSATNSSGRAAQVGVTGMAAGGSRLAAEADAGFQLAFELEFVRIQVAILPVNSPSALLFATNAAVLTSTRQSTGASRLVASMSQLQAYAVRHLGEGSTSSSSISTHRGKARVPWLLSQEGGLQVPPGSSLCTVMSPFSLQITHSREGITAAVQEGSAQTASASQDLLVQVPEVEGVLEPWQFEALLDVIQNVLICPVPQVSMLLPNSAPRPAVDRASSVVAAREVVTALGRSLCCLHQEVHVLAPGTMHAAWAQPVGGGSTDGLGFAPSSDQLLAVLTMSTTAGAGGALSGGGTSAAARRRSHSREVLLSWCLDQVSGATDALDAARTVLQREESAAALLNARALPHGGRRGGSAGGAGGRQGAPLSTSVVVGRCSWALSKAGGTVFLSAHLHGLEYTSALDKNYTGTTRLAMHSLSVQEVLPVTSAGSCSTLGSPGPAGPLSQPRHVLKLWQPRTDPSASVHSTTATSSMFGITQLSDAAAAPDLPGWEYDYAFSMAAVHGGLEAPNFIVYDHIEVVLHPLELHITYALAMALQEYFALEESSAPASAAAAPHPPSGMGPLAAGSVAFAGVMPAPSSLTAVGAPAPGTGGGFVPQPDMHALTRVEESDRSASSSAAPAIPPDVSPSRSWFPRRGGHSNTAPNSVQSSVAGAPGPLASGVTNWSGGGGALAAAAGRRPTLSASAGGGFGGNRSTDGVTLRSRALTADEVSTGSAEPNRYGSVYRWRLRQLSARGVGAGASSMDLPRSARGASIKQRMGRRANRRKGAAGHQSATSLAGSTAASHDTAMLSAIPRAQHIYRFKHVRFNRMHVKLTYEGPPIGLNDFRLVLDHRVYQGLEGTWKTLLNKYKWDVVRSVLKSMAGMQKGKVHELEFGAANPLLSRARLKAGALRGAVPEVLQDALSRGGGLRQNLKALLGLGKSRGKGLAANAAAAGDPSVSSGTASTALIMDQELLQAAEALRQRQARLALLLGTVPPPPTRKLLLEHESEL